MPNRLLNPRTCALLALCTCLIGCPQTPTTTDQTSGDTGAGTTTTTSTPAPTVTPSAGPTVRPTVRPTVTPTPTPSPTATVAPTPTPVPTPRIDRVTLLNPIQQMWLATSSTDVGPVSIPGTYSFQVEVVTVTGTAVSTSSNVVWSSSDTNHLTIDQTGKAVAVVQNVAGTFQAVITAATSSSPTSATVSASVNVSVGNSGTLNVTIQ